MTRDNARADQRRRIIRATGELVARRGYVDVTVELIVKRAKVSYKTFYNHFENKEAAFFALFDAALEVTEQRVRAELVGVRSWPDRVVIALRAIVELIVSDPMIARAVIVEAPTAGEVIFERYERASRALVPLLVPGRELSPHGDQLPATLEVTLAGSVLWAAYQRLIIGEGERIEGILPEMIELVLRPYLGEVEAAEWANAPVATS